MRYAAGWILGIATVVTVLHTWRAFMGWLLSRGDG